MQHLSITFYILHELYYMKHTPSQNESGLIDSNMLKSH